MRQLETIRGALPVPTATRPEQKLLRDRDAPKAAFVSQLIAERYHLATQRVKRQAPVADVLRTYDAGGKIAIRRLPPGYRMNLDV